MGPPGLRDREDNTRRTGTAAAPGSRRPEQIPAAPRKAGRIAFFPVRFTRTVGTYSRRPPTGTPTGDYNNTRTRTLLGYIFVIGVRALDALRPPPGAERAQILTLLLLLRGQSAFVKSLVKNVGP